MNEYNMLYQQRRPFFPRRLCDTSVSLLIAILGMIFISDLIVDSGPHALEWGIIPGIIVMVIGWLGCQLDSLFGATLQKKGFLTNNTVNFSTIMIGSHFFDGPVPKRINPQYFITNRL